MTKAVNSFSVFLAYAAFILIFLAGYDFGGIFTLESITPLILKALLGAVLFWFSGMIIGDIVIRGIVEDIDAEKLDPLEGGFEQRIAEEKKKKRVFIVDKELVKAINTVAKTKEVVIDNKRVGKDKNKEAKNKGGKDKEANGKETNDKETKNNNKR